MGGDTESGSMFAGDFVGISETPEGWQKQLKEALEHRQQEMEGDGERQQVRSRCM